MIRRLKKVTSQAELQQLIDAGIIVSPYIAFDSSSNVTNMVLPAEREISEIEYEQEVSCPVKLVGAITPEYYVQEGYTACRLSFTVHPEHISDHDFLFLLMCQKSYFDSALANSAVSREEFIGTILNNAYNNAPKTLDFTYAYAVNVNSRSLYPFDTDVPYVVSAENMAGDDLMWVPYDNSYPNDNTYYLFYGYSTTGEPGSFDIVGEVAQYRVMPYLSDSSTFVYNGMDLVAHEKFDPDTGESMGQYRNFEARVPGNTVYDRARYAWCLEGDDWADAMENSREAVCDATTTFSFSDYDAPEYINDTDQTLEGFILVQLYNSVTGDESEIKDFSTMYVEPSGEGDDTPDASVYSTAHISSFDEDPQQEGIDDGGNVHVILVPTIEMTNNDANMNYFQLGMYDAAEEGNAWDPIESLYEWACENSYVELSSVFNGETSASFSAGAYMSVDSYQQANDGTTYKFVGRYVNGYVQNTTDEWGNQYEELVVDDAKPWIVLGQYPAPEPEVMFDSDSDDGLGTITFDAYLNTQADDAGMYYKVAVTNNSDWDAFVAKEGANADYNDYLMTCLEEGEYTGTEDTPDSITASYPTPSEGFDSGDVNVVLFDDQDEIVNYWTVRGWVWPAM